jgi:hypothetical protein
MTQIYITIDTEYSAGLYKRAPDSSHRSNFDLSIAGKTPKGDVGIEFQMDVFDRHGLKAVFFVDPMPALVWGTQAITDIVRPIIDRGHDVQLHVHTEWLEYAGANNPVGNRVGLNIKDFNIGDQSILLDYAIKQLMAAGAPRPVAFRAGNYGANDDTLRALAQQGLAYDSSHCPGIASSHCDISLGANDRTPLMHCGILEVPIGSIADFRMAQRHAQLTALSASEICNAIRHARDHATGPFTLVSHSFELLSRDRTQINHVVKRRFESLCAKLAQIPDVHTATYAADPPKPFTNVATAPLLPQNIFRTGWRLGEQALGNALYGAQ